jgi:hypothetical protein
MNKFLNALQNLLFDLLGIVGVVAIILMIKDCFDFADRDYDWNNPPGSYRYTRAHYVLYGFSILVCVGALVAFIFCPTPLPPGQHWENLLEDSALVGHTIDKENYDQYADEIARAKEARRLGHH